MQAGYLWPMWRPLALFRLELGTVILSGWKAIAHYLDSGIRTVQRWEQEGLPVHRAIPGRRSHVVAHSDEIDNWIGRKSSKATGEKDSDLLSNFARARKLTEELVLARKELKERMAVLRKELAELRAKRRHSL
jgi:phage terminase Nu1 subunit (DNA packaging protein)